MRSSSFAMFGAVGLLLVTASGCRIEARTQTSFEDKTQPPKVSTRAWAGEPITIENNGINPLVGTGGLEVKIDPAATKITAEANFAASADDDKEADAKLSITDAIGTFQIEETQGGFKIVCRNGKAHGTSSEAASGCKILRVTLPPGTAAQPHNLIVGNGSGSLRLGLAEGGGVPYVKNLTVDNNGLSEVNIRINPVKDANIVVTGEDAVQVALPKAFSAAKVTFTVDEDDAAKIAARINASAFPGMASGSAYPAAGATADAAASLNVQSLGPFDSDTITISAF